MVSGTVLHLLRMPPGLKQLQNSTTQQGQIMVSTAFQVFPNRGDSLTWEKERIISGRESCVFVTDAAGISSSKGSLTSSAALQRLHRGAPGGRQRAPRRSLCRGVVFGRARVPLRSRLRLCKRPRRLPCKQDSLSYSSKPTWSNDPIAIKTMICFQGTTCRHLLNYWVFCILEKFRNCLDRIRFA